MFNDLKGFATVDSPNPVDADPVPAKFLGPNSASKSPMLYRLILKSWRIPLSSKKKDSKQPGMGIVGLFQVWSFQTTVNFCSADLLTHLQNSGVSRIC